MSTPGSLKSILDAIISELRAAIPALGQCSVIEAALDVQEVTKELREPPAVLICLKQFDSVVGYSASERLKLSLSAYLFVSDMEMEERIDTSTGLSLGLCKAIEEAEFNDLALDSPSGLAASARGNLQLDAMACSVWEVIWSQTFKVPRPSKTFPPFKLGSVRIFPALPEEPPDAEA
ncbi:MAG: hypothetical protein LBM75_09220 [Myxococcales bacterium]|jgi:hypothetical protein|nr:hypothetical protein [Myxococcales bacterium]